MKKLVCFLLILSVIISLVSCGDTAKNPPTLNGVKLTEFTIVYDEDGLDYNKRAAEYIRDEVRERIGIELSIVDDGEAAAEHEIVVGETDRPISAALDAECEGLEFGILASEGSIALEGDYFIIAAAAYFFINTYVVEPGYEASVPETVSVHQPIVKKANNFILLIGDGMGVYQSELFGYMENDREYSDGEDLFYAHLLPYRGFSRTNSLSGVTDSAAGGTALACGIKTNNGYIGKDSELRDVKSLTELAYELGMAGGVMSTESKTGATPSAFSAHASDRSNTSEITSSQLAARVDYGIVIDCGYNYYNQRYMEVIEGHIEDTLGKLSKNEKGFFLMYEEAHIDKHSHSNDVEGTFDSLVRFNQAIARFMEYAFYNPDTFILITADHETGGLYPDENGSLGYHTSDHTGADVPVFAYGAGAELFDGLTVENIQIAHTIASLMGENNFGDQSVYKSLMKKDFYAKPLN